MEKGSAFLIMFLFLRSGCVGAIDIISDAIDNTIDVLDGNYPQLELRASSFFTRAQSYEACESLLHDLQRAVYDEMVVNLDQQSYWHWISDPWMRMYDDFALAEDASVDLDSGDQACRKEQ